MLDYFPDAVAVVLEHEGGLTKDPKDPGGITNFGISARFLKLNNISLDVETLTKENAINLYLNYFWVPNHFALIVTKPIAIKLFDTGVNIGPGMAIKLAQDVISLHYTKITVDGILGTKTLAILNTLYYQQFLVYYRDFQAHYYRNLVYHSPQKASDLNGWLNRAKS